MNKLLNLKLVTFLVGMVALIGALMMPGSADLASSGRRSAWNQGYDQFTRWKKRVEARPRSSNRLYKGLLDEFGSKYRDMKSQRRAPAALQAPPPNDNCADEIDVTDMNCPFTDAQDTTDATNEPNEPETTCGDAAVPTQSNSVWYGFTSTSPDPVGVAVNTFGSNYDTVVQVYESTGPGDCDTLVPCACDDDGNPDGTSFALFVAQPGVLYKIKVAGFGATGGGSMSLRIDCMLIGDLSCVLLPPLATNKVGRDHTVTVTLLVNGVPAPIPDIPVQFNVTDGPNAGTMGMGVTDDMGQTRFTYTGNGGPGTDTIVASGTLLGFLPEPPDCDEPFSCTAAVTWKKCPFVQVAEGTTEAESLVALGQRFRDEVLSRTPRGQQYIRWFDQFSDEIVSTMVSNPGLLFETQQKLERYQSVIASMVDRGSAVVSQADLKDVDELLRAYAVQASPRLRRAIEQVRRDLRDPRVQAEFGIRLRR